MVEVRVTADGEVYVDKKRITELLKLDKSRHRVYTTLRRLAESGGRDAVFNSPYELITHLMNYFGVATAIDFTAHLLSLAGALSGDLEALAQLVKPSAGGGQSCTLIPRVLADAYTRLSEMLTQSFKAEVDIDIDIERSAVGRAVSFPYLTWYGFVEYKGVIKDVGEFSVTVQGEGLPSIKIVTRPLFGVMRFIDLVNTLYFVKSLGTDTASGHYAKVAVFLPDPPPHLFVGKDELKDIELHPGDAQSSYFVHLFNGAVGKSFVAPVVTVNGIEWVETKVWGVSPMKKESFLGLLTKGVILRYRHGEYRGSVVLVPRYSDEKYHRAVEEFMERNRGTELMRYVEDKARRFAERLNSLTDFLATVLTIIKLLT